MSDDLLKRFNMCKEFGDGFPDPIFIVNADGVILDVGGSAASALCVSVPDIIGSKLENIPCLGDPERKEVHTSITRALEGEQKEHPNINIRTTNGIMRAQVYAHVIGTKNAQAVLVVFRDITSVCDIEQKLQESELRYLELFENMQSGAAVYRYDEATDQFIITGFNKAAERSDKIIRQDVIGKALTEAFPGIEKTGFIDLLRRVYKTGKSEYFPPTLYEDQRIGRVWWEDYVYRLPNGEVIAAFANITERMKALEEVEKSMAQVLEERNKLQIVVQSIADAVVVLDASKNIILCNEAASKLSGCPIGEQTGKPYTEFLNFRVEGSRRDASDIIRDSIDSGEVKKSGVQFMFVNKNGEETPIAYSVAPLKSEDGLKGSVLVLRDITNDREIDRLKTEFVSIASHQLHAPLSGTKWFLELLLRGKAGPIAPELRGYLEQVYASNERMISLVEDLLFISNIGMSVKVDISKQNVDVIPLIDRAIKDNVDLIQEGKIEIVKSDSLPRQLVLPVDAEKVHRIFYNLISNAVKYSKPRGRVEIGCQEGPSIATFSLKDYGYGIPERQRARVFERFFRADNIITKVSDGTGLGLYIIKTLIEAHGGKIWFESEENMGTTFFFTIPKPDAKEKKPRTRSKKPLIRFPLFGKTNKLVEES
jgi:PAS domain S-box-containing protein